MVGNDRSGTVDNNLNLLKAVELALTRRQGPGSQRSIPSPGQAAITSGRPGHRRRRPRHSTFEQFWQAYAEQTFHLVQEPVSISTSGPKSIRAEFQSHALSVLPRARAVPKRRWTSPRGGAELNFTTIEGVTFATTVDSLAGHQVPRLRREKGDHGRAHRCPRRTTGKGTRRCRPGRSFRAPKYGRDDDEADEMAKRVMDAVDHETWKHRTTLDRAGSSGPAC